MEAVLVFSLITPDVLDRRFEVCSLPRLRVLYISESLHVICALLRMVSPPQSALSIMPRSSTAFGIDLGFQLPLQGHYIELFEYIHRFWARAGNGSVLPPATLFPEDVSVTSGGLFGAAPGHVQPVIRIGTPLRSLENIPSKPLLFFEDRCTINEPHAVLDSVTTMHLRATVYDGSLPQLRGTAEYTVRFLPGVRKIVVEDVFNADERLSDLENWMNKRASAGLTIDTLELRECAWPLEGIANALREKGLVKQVIWSSKRGTRR
jgi:hypothetical protein